MRADNGDAKAACQLGSFLAECGAGGQELSNEQIVDYLREQESLLAVRGDLGGANDAAEALILSQARLQQCQGIPKALLARSHDYLRQAALSGEPEAMVRYSRGEAFPAIGIVASGHLRSPQFDEWRSDAPRLVRALFDAGRPEAVLLLAEMHSPVGSTLSMLARPDPLLEEAHLRLARKVFADFSLPSGWTPAAADPELAREAEALAVQWHQHRFEGRRYSVAADTAGLHQRWVTGSEDLWPVPGGQGPACAEPVGPGQ